jgi:hypothetical protein
MRRPLVVDAVVDADKNTAPRDEMQGACASARRGSEIGHIGTRELKRTPW